MYNYFQGPVKERGLDPVKAALLFAADDVAMGGEA